MTRREIIERIVQGVLRKWLDAPQEKLRMQTDAAFPVLSNEVAEAFAQTEARRSTLRTAFSLTFAGGTATLDDRVLRKYMEDAVLVSGGVKANYVEPYSDFLSYNQVRLPAWAVNGGTIYHKTPQAGVLANYTGNADLTCIAVPAINADPDQEYAGPDDMVPQLVDAGISFLEGATLKMAAEAA